MSYQTVKTSVKLNPEFFRLEALKYNYNPSTDRKQWLNGQIINLKAAINNYVSEMQKLIEQGAQLDGQSDAAKWLTGIGSVAMVIPTGYTQIAGVVLNVAGMIVGAAEKKKDSKALQQLSGQARQIQLDMGQIKTYLDNYEAELQKINLLPIVLFATAAYLIRNRI